MVDTTPTRHPAQTLVIELQVVPHLGAVLAHPPVVGLVRRPVGGVNQGVGVGIYKAALLLQVIVTCTLSTTSGTVGRKNKRRHFCFSLCQISPFEDPEY